VFGHVVDEYDQARPSYPAALFDVIEPLSGLRVLDGGAGTGIASRLLRDRGASVIAFDISPVMLDRAQTRAPDIPVVVADGARIPFRSDCADLICFAQSWHWLDIASGCSESARVLRATGRWCGWWSHARSDGDPWFDQSWTAIEAACTGTHRDQRDIDWGEGVARSGLFTVAEMITVPWVRRLSVDQWITEVKSYSYIAALPAHDAADLLNGLRTTAFEGFPNGEMVVPYETWLWVAVPLSG
jgi:SAM-dependent methyltransferase